MSRIIEKMIGLKSKDGFVCLNDSRMGGDIKLDDVVYESRPKLNQYSIDSEVLLSYIYQKLGLKNPQSIPIRIGNREGVMNEKVAHGKAYIHDEMNRYRYGYVYFDNLNGASKLHTFYDKELMDSYIKISLADMMFWIQDRMPSRLYIKRGGKMGMQEVVPTQFYYPSFLVDYLDFYRLQPFYNGVYSKEETREKYKNNIKEFNFNQFMQPKEFLALLDKIDIKQCADEIFERYNYRVNSHFVDFVSKIVEQSKSEFEKLNK